MPAVYGLGDDRGESYLWARQPGESGPAYEAFRTYLNLGPSRTIKKAAEELCKNTTTLEDWSSRWGWVRRVEAFDQHLTEAETDGMVHALGETRDKNLALANKLRAHLDSRLDDFIEKRLDPTVRWTQALIALTKVDAAVFANVDDKKTEEKLDRVTSLLERLEAERTRVPEPS